jgi:hypothetical protein
MHEPIVKNAILPKKNMFKKLMLKKFEKSRLPGNSREFEPSKILENSRLENSRCIPLFMSAASIFQ